MLSSIFENDDVLSLLSKVSSSPRYYDKKKKDSINYEKFFWFRTAYVFVI